MSLGDGAFYSTICSNPYVCRTDPNKVPMVWDEMRGVKVEGGPSVPFVATRREKICGIVLSMITVSHVSTDELLARVVVFDR